jgi:hypothetical protein
MRKTVGRLHLDLVDMFTVLEIIDLKTISIANEELHHGRPTRQSAPSPLSPKRVLLMSFTVVLRISRLLFPS